MGLLMENTILKEGVRYGHKIPVKWEDTSSRKINNLVEEDLNRTR